MRPREPERLPRCRDFPFPAEEMARSQALLAIDHEAGGAFLWLMIAAWNADQPGRLSSDPRVLARLAFMAPESFARVVPQVATMFVVGEPGEWVLPWMVNAHAGQSVRIRAAHKAGKESGKSRRAKGIEQAFNGRSTDVERPLNHPSCPPGSLPSCESMPEASGSSDSEIDRGKSTHSATAPRSRFEKPTLGEIATYCRDRAKLGKHPVDPEAFLDHYESNGWRVGKTPMKDWRSAVRTWERNGFGNRTRGSTNGKLTPEQVGAFARQLREQEASGGQD